MVNYGTPIISIVDVNYDVRQPNPAYLNLNAFIQSSSSSPVYVQGPISSIGSIGSIGNIGNVSTVGAIGNVSSPVGVVILQTTSSLGVVSSPLFFAPMPVASYVTSALVTASTIDPWSVYIGGARQADVYIMATVSALVSTATYSLSVNILPFVRDTNGLYGYHGPSIFTSTFTSSYVALFLPFTENSSTFLGDKLGIYINTISTIVYSLILGVIAK